MTVSAQTPLNRSAGNGVSTVFAYNFKVLAEADMEVSVDGVVKTLTTDYTLSGVGTDSGNVTFLVPPADLSIVVRRRNMSYTRSVDYQDQGELPTDTLDDDQDAPILMIQQLDERQGRSITVPPESSGVDLELPAPTALSYLRWNALATALENVLLADVSLISLTAYAQTLLDAVDADAARAVLNVGAVDGSRQDFRLTLTTGLPVTTADVTGATTIYAAPFSGKYIDLFDGTNWNRRSSAQFSLALGTLTSGLPYDVFCYDNAGTPTLEFTAWTNTTTRATALAYQDGVLCKSGALTRRYMGSFLTTSTTATEDSASKRYLFNYNHRKPRFLERKESTASWTYTTATWRQANGSTANQVNFFVGVVEDAVSAHAVVNAAHDNTQRSAAALALNSITVPGGLFASNKNSASSSVPEPIYTPSFEGMPALGLNYIAWLEWSQAVGTTTWYGVFNASNQQVQSGLQAKVMA